jgi:hypothetical protein
MQTGAKTPAVELPVELPPTSNYVILYKFLHKIEIKFIDFYY